MQMMVKEKTLAKSAMPILRPNDFEQFMIRVGDLNMHVVIEGPENGTPVLLLHGFPEFWYSWRYQIKALAAAGYRVLAPDQRGYNLTDKQGPFDLFALVEDAVGLLRTLGYAQAHIVGHDWGGAVAWTVGILHPEITDRLIVCNLPHPGALAKSSRQFFLPQMIKSWYIFMFQLPWLPEQIARAGNYRMLANWLMRSGRLCDEELAFFREAWRVPGALNAEINWYRSWTFNARKLQPIDMYLHMPVHMIWGNPDFAIDVQTAEWSYEFCDQLEIHYLSNSGHFVQQDSPDEVNDLLLTLLPCS